MGPNLPARQLDCCCISRPAPQRCAAAAMRERIPIALGLLPALALVCVLGVNWAAGSARVETLQFERGVNAPPVDIESGEPMRMFAETLEMEPGREVSEMPVLKMPNVFEGRMLSTLYCSSECGKNQIVCTTGPMQPADYIECKALSNHCRNDVCRDTQWASKVPCWNAARDNFHNCFSRSSDAYCKRNYIASVAQC